MTQPAMNHAKGLFAKYHIERLTQSSRGIDHKDCQYFVLDISHDPHARNAALAYAESCWREYPNLASDLRHQVDLATDLFGTSKAPSSPVETTAGSEQRQDHTGVIRGADEADECAHTALSLIYRRERDEARDEFSRYRAEVAVESAQMAKRNLMQVMTIKQHQTQWDRLTATIAERDATIERLWAQLNEATNVPDAPSRVALAERIRALCEDAEDRRDWVRCADLRAMLGNS